jgi:hypothetical protein
MSNIDITQWTTTLVCEEVIVRAMPFFSAKNWTPSTQTARSATFKGNQRASCWILIGIAICGLLIPGTWGISMAPAAILIILLFKKSHPNLIITTNPVSGGSEVLIHHPKSAEPLVKQFIETLPAYMFASSNQESLIPSTIVTSPQRFCGHCGAKLEPDSYFCSNCGNGV